MAFNMRQWDHGRRNIVNEFARYFRDEDKLENWRRLCKDLDLPGHFSSITQCRRAIKKIHVNIHDFLDAINSGEIVHQFHNHRELAKYTRNTKRFYPLAKAKEGGPVRALLAHIRERY